MFTLIANMLDAIAPKKSKSKYFEPLFENDHHHNSPSPGEIRQMVEKLSRCSHCHFLIFDNYWSNEIEQVREKLCSTCGHKL